MRRYGAGRSPLSLAPGSPLGAALPLRSVRRFGRGGGFRRRKRLFVRPFGGALARARLAALVRRSRSRPARRLGAALSLALGSPLGAALSLALGSPLWRGGGFRRRQRLFVRPCGGALAPLGSPLRECGALARARFAALARRSRSRPVRRVPAARADFTS